jgi:hypothetical protein
VKDKAEKLHNDIQMQRLRDAAAVRHQHPIARVQNTALLADITNPNPKETHAQEN